MATRVLGPTGSKRRRRFLYVPFLVAALVVLGVLVTGGSVLAAPGTDANVNNYQQCANDKPASVGDTTDCVPQGWINGILNANNSQYHEDQVTAQRLGLDLPSGTGAPLTGRKIILKYLARKGQGGVGNHAYDSLATWNFTQVNANRCQGLAAADCPGGSPTTFLIPSDPTVVADSNGTGTATSGHELPDANRMMTMFGGTITGISTPAHDNASGSGDDYASITVTYSVTTLPTKVQLLFGGHLAASVGPRGWGANVGSSFINGGPYHIKLTQVDNSSIGNRDNQITSGAILPTATTTATTLHETNSAGVDVSPVNNGDPISINAGGYVTDYAAVTPSDSTGSVAFKYYSSATACSGDTGGTAAGGGTLSSGSATSSTVQFNTSGTFYWRAFFTGTGVSVSSSSTCEVLNVRQPTSTGTTLHETDLAGLDVSPTNNGDPISINAGGYVTDYASVTPITATGTVAFKYYASSTACSGDTGGTAAGGGTLSSGSATSSTVQFSTSGTFYWRAFFTGTGLNNNSSSGCETLNVRQPTSTGTTLHETDLAGLDVFPSNNGLTITVLPGAYVTDVASVTPNTAAGSVAFKYYGSADDCANDTSGTAAGGGTLSSGSATSNTVQFNTPGTFYWKAFFTGTGLNNDSQSPCNEILTVQKASPTLGTAPTLTPQDSATLSGIVAGGSGTMSVSFKLFGPGNATCDPLGDAPIYTESIDVTADGTVTTSNTSLTLDSSSASGVYRWLVNFTGNSKNNDNPGVCGDESFNFQGILDRPAS
jgi:hypothetical protein